MVYFKSEIETNRAIIKVNNDDMELLKTALNFASNENAYVKILREIKELEYTNQSLQSEIDILRSVTT